MRNFLAECHRRRVFRVAALYIVAAWVVLQVADLAFESWGIPATALRRVWFAAILGFPAALVFGWRFDIVGGRIVRTPDRAESADISLRRPDYIILATLIVVLIAIAYGVGVEITARRASDSTPIVAEMIDPRSIAVLPFNIIGAEQVDSEFLATGIQDDLLTRLSQISDLRVISRTSVEQYRDTTKKISEIGAELGVGKILEGGIQKAGDQIRVNVQLIDSVADEHVWADTFDQSLTASNVFAIQTEIVEEIAQQLQANLSPREARQVRSIPTDSLEAYTVYLRGLAQSDIESVASMNEAIASFQSAIEIDPDFALAYVGLADAYLILGVNFLGGLPVDESNALAEPPLMKALELDGNLGQAYATLGLLRRQQGDQQAAEEAYRKAIALQPNYSRAFRLLGQLRHGQGMTAEARELFEKALALDPYSAPVNFDLARSYDVAGQFEEALERYLRVIEIEPDHAFAYVYIAAIHYLVYGSVDESLLWYHEAAKNDVLSPSLQAGQTFAYLELGDPESAKVWVEEGLKLGPETFWPLWASLLLNTYLGDDEAARQDARTMLDVYPRNSEALAILRDADLAAGRYEVARTRYARAYRELTEPEVPAVDASNYSAAVDLALVLIRLGEQDRANDLLENSLAVIDTLPRLGTGGYYVTDVQIFALQQRQDRAIRALRQAIDEGWRFLSWYYLDHDPNLDSIRDDPRFEMLRQELMADLALQARRANDLKASGEL